MGSKMGRAIVANSSLQLLLKQSPTAVDVLSDVFKLTEEEKKRLANFPIGQGLFFAGPNHVHIQIEGSDTEKSLVDTRPQTAEQPQAPAENFIPMESGTSGYIDTQVNPPQENPI